MLIVVCFADRSSGGNNDRGSSGSSTRPQTPPPPMLGQRMSSKTRVTSGGRRKDRQITHVVPKHSPLHASPNYPSPNHHRSPKRDVHVNNSELVAQTIGFTRLVFTKKKKICLFYRSNHPNNALASLPSIMDDYSVPSPQPPPPPITAPPHLSDGENRVDVMSDSSSSSDVDSDSDSDSDHNTKQAAQTQQSNGHSNGARTNLISQHILNEDLCLSESGSDSDWSSRKCGGFFFCFKVVDLFVFFCFSGVLLPGLVWMSRGVLVMFLPGYYILCML